MARCGYYFPFPVIIFPVGSWCIQKKEVRTLTSRIRKIDPTYAQPLGEMIDLDQLPEDESEGEDIILQSPQPLSLTLIQMRGWRMKAKLK